MERIKTWRDKIAPGNILRLENNRYHIWGDGEPISYPVLHPRGVARDLKALKGISLGDTGEQSQVGGKWRAPALEHITLYVQSRFLWDADQDVDQVLDEYCALFYGPAAKAMKEAITYAEQNLAFKDQSRGRGRGNPANVPLAVSLRLRELLENARQTRRRHDLRQTHPGHPRGASAEGAVDREIPEEGGGPGASASQSSGGDGRRGPDLARPPCIR